MKPDSGPKGKRDSDKSSVDKKARSSASGPNGTPLEKKRRKPSGIQFTNVIEKINEGFVSLDAQMNCVYINRRGSELLMRKPEELIGKNYWEVYPQHRDTSFGRAYLQALETQTPIVLEDIHGPGERWFEKRIYPSEGGLSIFFNDITQRKQTEETLYRIDERLLATYQYAPIGIVECSPDAKYINVNDEFCSMLRYEKQELLTLGIKDVTHTEDLASDLSRHQQLIQAEIPSYKIEKRFVRKDGETVWAEVTRSAVHHANGTPLYTIGVVLDITERKHAEQALREKDEQLRRVTDVTPVLFSECSRDLRYLFVNRAAAEFLGSPAEQIIGQPIVQIMGEKAFETILPHIERVLNGERVEYEAEIPYRAAGQRFVHVVYVPKRDETGTIDGWLATVTDMTERKQAEEKLHQSEERFRILANTVPSMVWTATPNGTIEYASDRWYDYTGLTPEQNATNWAELVLHPDDYERCVREWAYALKTVPDEYLIEVRNRRHDGQYRWFQTRAVPARDEHGNVTAWYGVTTDIHDRVESERILRESEQRLRLASQAARACTWEMNFRDQSYKLGDNFEEVVGFSPDLLPEKSDEVTAMINVPEDLQAVQEAVLQAIQTRSEVPPLQYRVKNPQTQDVIWLEVNAKLVYNAEGKPDRMFGMVQNITGRKAEDELLHRLLQREREQRASAELAKAEAEQAKGLAERELSDRKLAEAALGTWADSPLPQEARPRWLRYGAAFAAMAVAVLLRYVLDPLIGGEAHYAPLLAATAFSVWYGGVSPALLSALVGYLGIEWLVTDWQSIANPSLGGLISLGIYLLSSATVIFLGEAVGHAQRHAHQSAGVAVERKRQAESRLVEQQRTEAALRASEQRFRDIFESAGVSVWVEDFTEVKAAIERLHALGVHDLRAYCAENPDFVLQAIEMVRLVDVNQETLTLFGAQSKGQLLHSLSDIFLSETQPVFLEELLALAEGRETLHSETQLRTLDGRKITVLVTLHYSAQDASRVVVTLSDITERKRMEQELARERELLERLFETMPVMISIYDPDTQSLRLNAQFEQMIGWKSEEVTIASLLTSIYPDPEYLRQVTQRMTSARPDEWVEAQVRTRDGRTLDTLWSNVSILNSRNIGLGIDITERKRAEQALTEFARQQEALYQLADQLQRTESLQDVFDPALRAILNALQCDRAAILLYDEAQVMRFAAWQGLSDSYRQAVDGHSPWQPDVQDPEPVCIDDIEGAELEHALKAAIRQEGIGALAFLPLVSSGKLIGKFMVYFNAPHTFDDHELEFGLTIGRQMASAIDRKRADDRLRASEALHRTIARSIPGGGVYVIDKDLRYLIAEGPVTEAFGLTREMLEGHTVSEVFPAEPAARMEDRLRRNFDGETVSFETNHNGRVYWTQQAPLLDTFGQVIVVTIDITERKRAEEALRQSEERFARFMQNLPGLAWIKDMQGRYVYANDAAEKAFQAPRAKLYGRTDAEIFPPEVAAQFKKNDERALQEAQGVQVIEELEQDDGVLHSSLVTKFPIPGPDGDTVLIGGTAFDITERKGAEEALRESEERYRFIVENTSDGIWATELTEPMPLSLSEDEQVEWYYRYAVMRQCNLGLAHMYGFESVEQVLGLPMRTLMPPDQPGNLELSRQFIRARYRLVDAESVETDRDGNELVFLNNKIGIIADGKLLGEWGTNRDITARKRAEEGLKQARAQAEETANRMARLQQVTSSLVRAATPAQLAEMILEQGTRVTGAADGLLVELVNQGSHLKTIAALGHPPAAIRTEPVPLAASTPMSDCIRSRQAIWLGSQDEFAAHYPALAESRRGFGNEATVALPLIVGERVLAGLAFSFREQREFLVEERGFLLSVAQQCAQSLERVLASEALRESEERYRALVNQATAGIVRKDPNGKILFVNLAFCEMLGYAANELLDKSMWQFTHDDDVSENRRLYNRLIVDGTAFELEKRLLRRDGSILWAVVSVSPVMDSSGKPQSAVSVYADITDRKQAEMDLNESRERFRNLFNLVPVAVYSCNADGLIQEYNRSAIELWGREPLRNDPSERYCGSFKIFFPDGRFMPHKSCPMARMLRGETLDPNELEILVERTDGSRRNVIAHPLPLRDERGKIVGAINCLYDITDRQQAESRLALLAEVSELTRKFEDPVELMSAVADAVGRHFQVRRCLFNEIDLDEDLEIIHHDYHDGIESVVGVHKLSDYSSTTTAEIRNGRTIVNHDSKTDPRTAGDYVRSYLATGERAYVAVPLMRDDHWAATMWISDDAPRQWRPAEVSLLEAVAERTWTAAEKLRIHAELRDSEESLRVTFNTTAVGFATLTPDLRFVEVNDAYCAITGYPREMLTQMDSYALTHAVYSEEKRKQVANLVAGEIPSFTLEKIYIRRDGTEIWVQNNVSLVRDADGKPLHIIYICQDITERKQAEEALQQLNMELEQRVLMRTAELSATNVHLLEEIEERAMIEEALRESDATTRLILDTSPDAIVIANRDGRIMRVNAQIVNLFGYRPEEVLGKPIESLIPERFHLRHLQHRAYYNERPHRRPMGMGLELFGQRKDGTEFPVDVTLTPIQNQNIADWDTMVTIRDSMERKRMEADLRESHKRLQVLSQRLVEVQEDERRAIARELHDRVGQSLAALSLNLTIVSNELSSLVDEQANLRLLDSRQLVTEVIALVRDVMADLRPAVLDDYGLEAALHTTLEKFRERFGMDIRFERNKSLIPRLNPSIEMTLLRIAQEAIANAGRHAKADQVNLSLQLEQNRIRLTVQDNGTGIQSLEQVQRLGSHGLTIMRERAEAVGGIFQVSSTPGEGTKIEVGIPVPLQNPKE